MPRAARFWHSLNLARPWLMSLDRDADSGEDEIYSDDEIAPHTLTASPGWRKAAVPEELLDNFGIPDGGFKAPEPSVTLRSPSLPDEPTAEFAEVALEWHRLVCEAFKELGDKHGKEMLVWADGNGWKVETAKKRGGMSMEMWEVVAIPDGGFTA